MKIMYEHERPWLFRLNRNRIKIQFNRFEGKFINKQSERLTDRKP